MELGGGGGGSGGTGSDESGIPAHALAALGLLLKLPGYAAALLDEGAKAVHLLRLLMGVAHTEDGREYTSYINKKFVLYLYSGD